MSKGMRMSPSCIYLLIKLSIQLGEPIQKNVLLIRRNMNEKSVKLHPE